jgi:hypothetical protein
MNLRPLFWMVLGAGASLVAGAWGSRESLPTSSEPQQLVFAKTAAQVEASFISNTDYAAENVLNRTQWVKPKADPFGDKPVVVRRRVSTTVENHEPPPLVFPFEYVGKLTVDGKETLYLSKGEQIYPVAVGETLENIYRVEHTSNDSIELSYLPDSRKMTITLESITAKYSPGALTTPPNDNMRYIAPLPAVPPGKVVPPQPAITQLPVDHKEITADSRPISATPAPVYTADGSLQQDNVPVNPSQPRVPMPPGMLPPGMMPPGAPQ